MATTTEINEFIKKLGALAVAECNTRIANGQGFVLPSVCISQSALETGYGTSGLMTKANAFFGIKAGGSWTGKVYRADTWEVSSDGQAYNTTANFRAYDTIADSVRDYYDLIGNNSRYSDALSFGTDQSKWKTPRQCITAIWAGGYATDTLYVEKNMNIITSRKLDEWDRKIDGITGVVNYADYFFTKSDLVQGKLILTDSGRSIGNDKTDVNYVAIDWEKAFTVSGGGTFKINLPYYWIKIARLTGDSPSIDSAEYSNGDTITFQDGEKIGFYIRHVGSAGITTLLESIPSNIDISFVNTTRVGFNEIPVYSDPIAIFVKVE